MGPWWRSTFEEDDKLDSQDCLSKTSDAGQDGKECAWQTGRTGGRQAETRALTRGSTAQTSDKTVSGTD